MGAKGWFTFVFVFSILSAVHVFNNEGVTWTVVRFVILAVGAAIGYISCQ